MEDKRIMYQIYFYVPIDNAEEVKEAMFAEGAGHQGEYAKACWQAEGQGQFLPSSKANPTIGKTGNLSLVKEFKVEMLCSEHNLLRVIKALKNAHPYEEPAFGVLKLESVDNSRYAVSK